MFQNIKLYACVFLVLSALFFFLLRFGFFAEVVFFYRGILLLLIGSILTTILFLWFYKKNLAKRVESIISAVLVTASLHLAFFVTIPVTLDRSISVFLLDDIYHNQQGITKQELTDHFLLEYVTIKDAVGRRIFEQEYSNNLRVTDGTITLTDQGTNFLLFANFIERLYGI